MTLRPAPPDLGIVFSRIDLGHRPWITASWEHAVIDDDATHLVNESGVEVTAIEHLMSALCGCGIDNAMIELDGPEVPAMDGSAAPFVFLLECAGIAEQAASRRALRIRSPIRLQEEVGTVSLSPGLDLTLDVACESHCAAIGQQAWTVTIDRQTYKREVSRARHFDFLDPAEEADSPQSRLGSAVTVLGDRIIDDCPLRFENEYVRHQVQCMIGDLYLAGGPILGQATARGHHRGMTVRLLEKLFRDTDAWSWSDLSRSDPPQAPDSPESVQRPAAVGA